jgi:hypothetical protein
MKKCILLLACISILLTMRASKEIEEAINNSQPERFLKLCPQDYADLMQHKDDYLKKAQEVTAKAWKDLNPRFSLTDLLRIGVGGSIVGLSAWLLHGLRPWYPQILSYFKKGQEQQEQTPEGQNVPLAKPKLLDILLMGASGSLLAGLGIHTIHKGLKKSDRFAKYFNALAVESTIRLALELRQNN